jgi:hypothetical protein
MENPELSQYRSAIVINSFARKMILEVERVHAAERDLDSPPSRWQSTPLPKMGTANHDLKDNCIIRDMASLHPDFDVG